VQPSETVLVVEDSEDVLALAQEHLERLGYTVLTATSGEEALDLIEGLGERKIDLVFSDIVMPGGVNGLVLAETVRERLPGVPVLLTTGYNDDLVMDGPRASAMDLIGKPYRKTELADRVRAALNGRARARGLPAAANVGPRHEA
jgi:CheY-like chemotaxis protein